MVEMNVIKDVAGEPKFNKERFLLDGSLHHDLPLFIALTLHAILTGVHGITQTKTTTQGAFSHCMIKAATQTRSGKISAVTIKAL